MDSKRVVVLGSGKRVRETALPALHRARERFSIAGVFARTAKHVEIDGTGYDVRAIDDVTAEDLADTDLVYMAVTKDAVPAVLSKLQSFDVSGTDLLIDTPVVRFKHFRHIDRLARFRNAWVAEDCIELPWFDAVREAVAGGAIGHPRGVLFLQSAYAYHALATAKTLLGVERVVKGRRRRISPHVAVRELTLAGAKRVVMLEPRDYSIGRVSILGSEGSISDWTHKAEGNVLLEPVDESGVCRGFRVGDVTTRLDDDEAALTCGADDGPTVTARMDAMKRVGFLRLLRRIHEGRGAYPIDDALEDMVVDYHLEKLGMYRSNPLTSPRSALGRLFLKTVTRAGG